LTLDNKQLMRKARERHVFLFDLYLLFAKEVKDANGGAVKYIYKSKMMTSELGVTEHVEGDECKFAVWTGSAPMVAQSKIALKASCLESKQNWVKRLREVIQDACFSGPSFSLLKSPAKVTGSKSNGNVANKYPSNNVEDANNGPSEIDPDKTSLLSFGSGNTTDSEKVSRRTEDS
jgi:triple functional domain protein